MCACAHVDCIRTPVAVVVVYVVVVREHVPNCSFVVIECGMCAVCAGAYVFEFVCSGMILEFNTLA